MPNTVFHLLEIKILNICCAKKFFLKEILNR